MPDCYIVLKAHTYHSLGRPSIRDFDNLVNCKVSAKWYALGVQLDIDGNRLDEIECNNPRDASTCCREAFKYWLDNNTDASWESLLKALESEGVSKKNLAREIREKLSGKSQKVSSKRFIVLC